MKGRTPHSTFRSLLLLVLLLAGIFFIYTSLNLKNIDYGYKLQELAQREKQLSEEIDRLRAERARLLSLERVERIATEQLGYRYPQADQLITVRERADAH